MRRKLVLFFVATLGLLVIPVIQAGAAITPGTKCSKAGIQSVYKMKIFTCVKSGSKLVWNKGVSYYLSIPTPAPTVTINTSPQPAPTVTVTATPAPAPTVTVTATPAPAPTVTVTATPAPAPTVTVTSNPTPSISTGLGTYNNPVPKGEAFELKRYLLPEDSRDTFSISVLNYSFGTSVSEELCKSALDDMKLYVQFGVTQDKICSDTYGKYSADNSKYQYIKLSLKIKNEDYNQVAGMQYLLGYIEFHSNGLAQPDVSRPGLYLDANIPPKNELIGPRKTVAISLYCYLPITIKASDLESGMVRFKFYNEKGNSYFKLGNS